MLRVVYILDAIKEPSLASNNFYQISARKGDVSFATWPNGISAGDTSLGDDRLHRDRITRLQRYQTAMKDNRLIGNILELSGSRAPEGSSYRSHPSFALEFSAT